MRWAVLVVLCGCNWAFGIVGTQNGDAHIAPMQYFDAGIDGLPSCPPVGTPLKFLPALHQVLARNCSGYTLSSADVGVAIALCSDVTSDTGDVETGPADVSLAPVAGLQTPHATSGIYNPRISPDGQTAYLEVASFLPAVAEYESFQRNADGSWTQGANLAIPFTAPSIPALGTMTASPHAHLIVELGSMYEYVSDDVGGWSLAQTYTNADLGVAGVNVPAMTTDGLRVVFAGSRMDTNASAIFYADRATLDDRFGVASIVEGLPPIQDPYLTADCERIYFSGLQSILYQQRAMD